MRCNKKRGSGSKEQGRGRGVMTALMFAALSHPKKTTRRSTWHEWWPHRGAKGGENVFV